MVKKVAKLGEREQVIETITMEEMIRKGFFDKVKQAFPNAVFFGLTCDLEPKGKTKGTLFALAYESIAEYEKGNVRLMTYAPETESTIVKIIKEISES